MLTKIGLTILNSIVLLIGIGLVGIATKNGIIENKIDAQKNGERWFVGIMCIGLGILFMDWIW